MTAEKVISYSCAVLLIASSIVLAFVQVFDIDDVASGTLMYIAQAFLLAGSIFGLDYYIQKLTAVITKRGSKAPAKTAVAILLCLAPAISSAQFIHVIKPEYTSVYDVQTKCPKVVTWTLRSSDLGQTRRLSSWRFESDVLNPLPVATHEDFTRSGYDRGHMCPAADRSKSLKMMRSTFAISNISAQAPSLNRGAWLISEDSCRHLAMRHDSVQVCVVPLFLPRDTTRIGRNLVAVPHGFYKSVWTCSDERVLASWFFFNR